MDTNPDLIYALHNQGSHLTRHQLLVLEILRGIPGHPDAGKIFEEAKKRDDRISLATVYRSLAVLKAAGLVEENRLGEGHGHFEAIQDFHHYHFTCLNCGKVIEFETSGIPEVVQELSRREKLHVTETYFYLRGYCPDCQKNEPQTLNRVTVDMEGPLQSLQSSRNHGEEGILPIPLSSLSNGKAGIVSNLEGDREFMTRVASLGFTIGAQVIVLQNHGQGPMIVSLHGAHIALGRQEAELIQVQLL